MAGSTGAVCCDGFNKTTRKAVVCPTCQYESCRTCCKRFVMESINDAACMNCAEPWSREFLVDNLTMAFVSHDYTKRREDVLLDREKAMLPQTMVEAGLYAKKRGYERRRAELKKQQRDMLNTSGDVKDFFPLRRIAMTMTLEEDEMRSKKRLKVANDMAGVRMSIRRLEYLVWSVDERIKIARNGKAAAVRHVRGCPVPDCRGFLTSDHWKCGICDNETCSRCHLVLAADAPHECNADDVKTAVLLMNDSKSCPKCATLIFKVDGCDQIWCTQCHVAFSWRTGQVETGRIHNPHYYEYLRQRNGGVPIAREIGDIPCGGLPNQREIRTFFDSEDFDDFTDPTDHANELMARRKIEAVAVCAASVLDYTIPSLRVEPINDANRDLRVKYLCNEIKDEAFKRALQRREKTRLKNIELRQVLNTFVLVVSDLMQNLPGRRDFQNAAAELDEVLAYIADALKAVAARYNTATTPIVVDLLVQRLAEGRILDY